MPTELDLVITGATVVTEKDVGSYDVGVMGERIAAVEAPGTLHGRHRLDASDLIVTPGAIDTHTHIEWPLGQFRSLDTFATATKLAATSGTTLVLDFVPSTREPLLDAAKKRLEQAQHSVIDYSLHPIISGFEREDLVDVERLVEVGMASFKIYTTEPRPDDADIRLAMETIAAAGGVPGFHAENRAILASALKDVVLATGGELSGFSDSRPEAAESAMISLVTHFARELVCPVFIYHVSGRQALAAVEAARRLNTLVRAETCTHYLVLDRGLYERPDAWKYVITPPLRDRASSAALWRGLREDSISCLASDHCAYGTSHKQPGYSDFRLLPPGAPGLTARMPMLWHRGVDRGELSLPQFAQATATRPARIFGLYPRKGAIRVGADADLVAWDPKAPWTWPVWPNDTGSDYDIYEGFSGRGLPKFTLLRGRVVARDGSYIATSGTGEFIPQRIDIAAWS